MAPIKFDNNIKDKLEKRTLQPSNDAWSTLSNQLDTHKKRNSRHLFLYLGIAASIVGVLFVTTVFFNTSEDSTITPQIVDTNLKTQSETSEDIISTAQSENTTANSNSDAIQNKENVASVKSAIPTSSIKNEPKVAQLSEEKSTPLTKKETPINDFKTLEVVANIDTKNTSKNEVVATNKLTLEEAKVLDVVNKIKELDLDGTAATDQEIEALLKQAEKEILKQRIYDKTTRTVNADALLQDVEEDLERSFRTKVFETLKSSYKTVKTAVAERNH
ncbi:hypothetical protein [Psychroserpens sp. SPM9]|uniref:hypothetical protein n=1 Tax=Psychroserpens sp. SPM9 TaxID=2975598 RepID=UPI0021A592CA|nr:hypothetical protein [Psychroserpens sp. SPM9]MDG5489982.1 hypothetical protein [Psychroserpens sp. SPM9]